MSPPVRPPTPAGAKLGDWMQDIQAQINSLVEKFTEYNEVICVHRAGCNPKSFELYAKVNETIDAFNSSIANVEASFKTLQACLTKKNEDFVAREDTKVTALEEKFSKIEKYEHKCGDVLRLKKEGELRDKRISGLIESVKETKSVHA